MVFLARTLSATSIPCYLNVVRILHLQHGFNNPLQEPLFKFQKELLMRGIKRINSNAVRQKLPITPDILRKLHGQLDLIINSLDASFLAACVIALFSFFRKSNLLVPSESAFDPQKTCGRVTYAFLHGDCCWSYVGLRLSNIATGPYWSLYRVLQVLLSALMQQ